MNEKKNEKINYAMHTHKMEMYTANFIVVCVRMCTYIYT